MTGKTLKPHLSILLIIVLSITFSVNGQEAGSLKDMFLEAESYYLFEEFADALPIYQKIYREEPENYNICFKIGVCYLNDPYQLEKSVTYLKKAAANISARYKENNYREKSAPPEALYYLGNAYRVNNKLTEAIDVYKQFKEVLDPEIYDAALVDKQIRSCEIAMDIESRPLYIKKTNLGDEINSRFAEINPLVSGDESTMVFTKKLQFYDAVFYSVKENGKWAYPLNLTPSFALDGNSYGTGLSWNGNELFVYRSDGFDGNIYVSRRSGDKWSKLEKLNDHINTKYWESHASLSPDGKTLYFTSNRKGGFGGLDIYTSKRSGKEDWGPAVNLGNVINSEYNEETPFLTGDGKTIYFSSLGHYNMGGYDIFYSTMLDDGLWSKPLNAGYPINTTGDDLFFVPVKNGEYAYYSMFDQKTGMGLDDIYRLEIFSDTHPRKFILRGITSKEPDLNVNFSDLTVKLIDKKTGNVFDETKANADGSYRLDAQSGDFDLLISGKGVSESMESLNIPVNLPSDEITHKSVLQPAEEKEETKSMVVTAEKQTPRLEISENTMVVTDNKPVAIKLNVDKNTNLLIEVFVADTFVKNENLQMGRRRFIYFYSPEEGTNLLKFTLTDNAGNSTVREVTIDYTPVKELATPESMTSDTGRAAFSDEYRYLSSIATGALKIFLQNLDCEKEGITSPADLYSYLYRELAGKDYTMAEVDELFIRYLSQKNVNSFMDEIYDAAPDSLRRFVQETNPDSAGVRFSEELVDFLESNAGRKGYTIEDLDYALSAIISKNQPALDDFLEVLNGYAGEELSYTLKKLMNNTDNYSDPFQLVKYLLSNALNDNYSTGDVQSALRNSASDFDLNFLYQSLLFFSEGNLNKTLANLNPDIENIHTTPELLRYLWIHSQDKGYTVKEIIDLVEQIRSDTRRGPELFRKNLARHASGNLKAFLQTINLEDRNISTFIDLLNYLINNSKFQNYNRETVYRLLLDIINPQSLDEFVKRLKRHTGHEIQQALNDIDLQQFSSPYELIQYLIGHASQYSYTEQDILNLLLKLALEQGYRDDNSAMDLAAAKKLKQQRLIIELVVVNLIIIAGILYILLRKKKKKK